MAVHTENTGSSQVDPAKMGSGQQTNTPPKKGFSFKGGLMGSPMGNGIYSETYKKMLDALTKMYKDASSDFQIAVFGEDRNANSRMLAYSIIVVAGRFVNDPSNTWAYHVLVLEATGDKPAPLYINENGQQVEVMRVASDAIDSIMVNQVKKLINTHLGVNKALPTDGTVVHRALDPENKDDTLVISMIARNTALAIGTTLTTISPGYTPINLTTSDIDSNLAISINFGNTVNMDAVGEPIRSDVAIAFLSQGNSNNNTRSLNTGDANQKYYEVDGFIDLLWNPVVPRMGGFQPYAMQPGMMPGYGIPTQKYVARMVITNILSNVSYTTESILLALYSAISLRENNNWAQYFRPMHVNGIDLKDIGALGIEANFENNQSGYGTRIDTKSDSFSLQDLGNLITALIQPGMIFSIDVPENGPQTWFESIFSACRTVKEAHEEIVRAANNLTNGEFARHWTSGNIIANSGDNRIHNGYYYDANDKIRDIRDFDYLAVANKFGDNNPKAIQDWSDTFTRPEYKEELRLFARKNMIQSMANDRAVFTGFSRRITFDANFLEALARGIVNCGISLRINTPLSGDLFNSGRASADFMSPAMLNSNSPMFNIASITNSFANQATGYFRY